MKYLKYLCYKKTTICLHKKIIDYLYPSTDRIAFYIRIKLSFCVSVILAAAKTKRQVAAVIETVIVREVPMSLPSFRAPLPLTTRDFPQILPMDLLEPAPSQCCHNQTSLLLLIILHRRCSNLAKFRNVT